MVVGGGDGVVDGGDVVVDGGGVVVDDGDVVVHESLNLDQNSTDVKRTGWWTW